MRGQIHVPDSPPNAFSQNPRQTDHRHSRFQIKVQILRQCNVPYVQWQTAIHTALSQLYKDTARLTNRLNLSCPPPGHLPSTHQNWAKPGRTQCGYVNWHRRTKSVKHSSFLYWTVECNMFHHNKTHLQGHKTPKMIQYKLQSATSNHPYVMVKCSR